MEILKECHFLYQCYHKTGNFYLNVYLLKIVVLFSNHENNLEIVFCLKSNVYLLSYFLRQHFKTGLFVVITKS